MRIALFDSGIGGITVLKEAIKLLPCENYLYYADTQNVPYGTKPKELVKEIIFKAIEFISAQNVKALVVACNTATSIAVRDLRSIYSFPIVGMEPAVKPALETVYASGKRVLVFATPLTLIEEKFHRLVEKIDINKMVDFLPLPELVEYAEKFDFSEKSVLPYLTNKLSGYDLNRYGAVVLGCTHFVLYKQLFRDFLPPHIQIIDGNAGTVMHLKHLLETNKSLDSQGRGDVIFYASGVKMDSAVSKRIVNELLR